MLFPASDKRVSITRLACLFTAFVVMGGCQSSRYSSVDGSALEEINESFDEVETQAALSNEPVQQPSEDVLQALVPGLSLDSEALQPVEERFDFVVQEPMDVREVFTLLTQGTEYSVAVHPSVKGSISALDLKNVTLQEAFDQLSDLYGFVIKRQGDIYQVMPGGLQTRIFNLNYLNVTRNGNSNMQIVASGISQSQNGYGNNGYNNNLNNNLLNNRNLNNLGVQGGNLNNGLNGLNGRGGTNSGGASINTTSEVDYWDGLKDTIMEIINSGSVGREGSGGGLLSALNESSNDQRSVIVSPHTGMIVVRAYPEELDQVAEFLKESQSALQRQVVLEAKILEVELKKGYQAGIDLKALAEVNSHNEISAQFNFIGDQLDAIGSPTAVSYNATDFNGVIKLLETQGNVQVISSPRISTLNNQQAVFKVGDEQFFLTQATTTSFGAGDQATTNQNTNLQPFFSGIALDVTPQISAEGDIILHIHPILSEVKEDIKIIRGEEFPLANSTTRESDSIARARNGEVIVISGLMQTKARGQEAGLPGARDIPVIGNAFEQKQHETVKTELVILLRALVDEDEAMQKMIGEHKEGFEKLSRQIDPYYR